MQRRISLTVDPEDMEPAQGQSTEVTEQDGPALMSQPPNDQAQGVDQLLRAGIVTHQIKNPDALDPMFAVSQLNDLPEVAFAAAFQDGLLLLGCPEGPPASIAEMVVPVAPPAAQPAPAATLEAKLEQVNLRLDDLQSAQENQIAPALSHINSISARLEYLVDALAPDTAMGAGMEDGNAAVTLADLDAQLKTLTAQPETPTDDTLSRIENAVSGLVAGTDEQSQSIFGTLEFLKNALETRATGIDPEMDQAAPTQLAALLDERMGDLSTAVAKMSDEVATLKHRPDQESDAVIQAVTVLSARVDDALAKFGPAESPGNLVERLDTIQQALEQPTQTADAVTTLRNQFDDLPNRAEIEAVFNTFKGELAKIAEQSETVAAQSQASITLLKRAAERDTVKTITEKLDGLTALLTENTERAEDDPLGVALGNLQEQVTLIAQASGTTALEEGLNALREDMRKVTVEQPAPVLDLTKQQQGFEEFTKSIGEVLEKFETSLDRMASISPEVERAAGNVEIMERLETLSVEINAALPPASDFAQVEARLEGLSQEIAHLMTPVQTIAEGIDALFETGRVRIDELKATLDQIKEQTGSPPEPHIDLTPILERIDGFQRAHSTYRRR